ncbi:sensor histidine kinase [Kutzneria buriramensis]|uniref:Signal transduction histidine kinase n=1 Tax=Kutzneria buriramensis TaxID=1045776 RepID=A0A3E0H607_9PSEU|nr:histidine kinase [Kutzneria buriramensis]REH38080.1 signal transduction histidine kinase [Kutzneria buriramensis]
MEATSSSVVADILDRECGAIVVRYEAELRAMGSRLLQDPRTQEECFRQARGIISDIARSLRGETTLGLRLSKDIGLSRASNNIHPSESLRAAMALFEAITTTVAGIDESTDGLLALALATNKLVSQRIRMASSSYMGFLLESIEQAHLRERKRISREVHDRVGGNVAAAHRQIELATALRATEPVQADAWIERAELTLRHTLGDVRRLVSDLRTWEPEGGLESSLRTYIDSAKPARMDYSLRVNGDESNLSPEIRGEAFLIIREAIRNAIRHSRASKLLTQVNITPNELYAFIEDDGVGVDLASGQGTRNAGLSSMRERAALLEGEIVIMSQLGRGTRVELLIPLRNMADGDA